MVNLGERLRRLRKLHGLSLRQLESESGVHFTTIARYEKMETNARMSIQELCGLADALHVTLDELAGRVPPSSGPRDPLEVRLDRLETLLRELPARMVELLRANPPLPGPEGKAPSEGGEGPRPEPGEPPAPR